MKATSRVMIFAAAAIVASFAHAQEMMQHEGHQDTRHDHHAMMAKAGMEMSSGEIRKVDKDAGKLTIKHGPLTNLDMPAMTMVFRVKDAAMLDQVKAGDKVEFEADKIDGLLTVTRIDVKN